MRSRSRTFTSTIHIERYQRLDVIPESVVQCTCFDVKISRRNTMRFNGRKSLMGFTQNTIHRWMPSSPLLRNAHFHMERRSMWYGNEATLVTSVREKYFKQIFLHWYMHFPFCAHTIRRQQRCFTAHYVVWCWQQHSNTSHTWEHV